MRLVIVEFSKYLGMPTRIYLTKRLATTDGSHDHSTVYLAIIELEFIQINHLPFI